MRLAQLSPTRPPEGVTVPTAPPLSRLQRSDLVFVAYASPPSGVRALSIVLRRRTRGEQRLNTATARRHVVNLRR